jgi:predicted amidohydrolase
VFEYSKSEESCPALARPATATEQHKEFVMHKLIVASVQQKLRLATTTDEAYSHWERYLRAARSKNADLVVLPELAGVGVTLALLNDNGAKLLKRAAAGRQRNAGLWQRMAGAVAGSLAALSRPDLLRSLAHMLEESGPSMYEAYTNLFSRLARECQVTLIAPSAWLPDPADGVIRNLTVVFGRNGETLGSQSKVLLNRFDEQICRPGTSWDVINSDAGAIGLMIGNDVLLPEVGRLLAFQGAELLVLQSACSAQVAYQKQRTGILARMQDNQLFAAAAFLVGENPLHAVTGKAKKEEWLGKSAIFAPQELTQRYNGVLVEMVSAQSEGVLTAEWNFPALRQLWETSETPIRRALPGPQSRQMLAVIYQRLQNLPQLLAENKIAPAIVADTPSADGEGELPSEKTVLPVDELPLVSSVTTRWPPPPPPSAETAVREETLADSTLSFSPPDASRPPHGRPDTEDETDEMDVMK